MYEAVAALLTFNASIFYATGESPRRRGNEHPTIVPYETFEAADGLINLGVANDDLWQRFCPGAERPDLKDDLGSPRRPIACAIARSSCPWSGRSSRSVARRLAERLDKAGVPSGAIRTVGEVCDGEVLRARDMVAEMPHPSAGVVKAIKSAMHLSENPAR